MLSWFIHCASSMTSSSRVPALSMALRITATTRRSKLRCRTSGGKAAVILRGGGPITLCFFSVQPSQTTKTTSRLGTKQLL